MDWMVSLAQLLLSISILVAVHEMGHLLAAKYFGMRVEQFSIGFPPKIFSFRKGETEYALSAIPLGGYVKMADERDPEIAPEDRARAFNRASVWQRIAIVSAGPIANLLLAVLLYAGTFMAGVPGQKPVLATPVAGTPAAAAAVQGGDLVTAVDGTPIASVADLRWRLLKASGNDDVALTVETIDRREATRIVSLRDLGAADWEGLFMPKLGLAPDLGPPHPDRG